MFYSVTKLQYGFESKRTLLFEKYHYSRFIASIVLEGSVVLLSYKDIAKI